MQPLFLIDNRGIVEPLVSGALRRRLMTTLPSTELADYAARNLGFVAAGTTGHSARLWLRPKLVGPKTLAAAIMWLERQGARRFCLTTFDASWQNRVAGSLPTAIQALVDFAAASTPRRTDFLRARRSVESLMPGTSLVHLLQRWRNIEEHLDLERLAPVLKASLADRYIVVDATGREVMVRRFGQGIAMVKASWEPQLPGTRMRDMYDYEYGIWGAQSYHEAHPLDEPILEDCDVIVNFPGHPRSRVTYKRLILPVRSSDGSRLLLGASTLDRNIELRVETGQEMRQFT